MEERVTWVTIAKALEALKQYPLCDRCLGRLFARLGYGWSNRERGDAIKRVIIMELHRAAKEGGGEGFLVEVAPHIGSQAEGVYRLLTGRQLEPEPCYICGGKLDKVISMAIERGMKLLRTYEISRFIVGVRVDERSVIEREEKLKMELGLPHGESIKSEVRREVGKTLMELGVAEVDFEEPEATLLIHFPSGEVEIQVNSLLIKGAYWKLARNVSQAYWPSPQGPRYFSVEQALWPLLGVLGAESIVVHAAGREDVDARMLGGGRPLIVEVKQPRKRRVSLEALEDEANKGGRGLVKFKFYSLARRAEVRLYKEEASKVRKTYRALVVVERAVADGDVEVLEKEFEGRTVVQRTPKRVLHRRPDIVRRKIVYGVKCRRATPHLLDCLVEAEGGLYVKELISGDDGRTSPSFTEVLGARAECVELDVVWVEREGMGEA
ncbi:MAG: tRNA pseudouridine(54/55) synthase Pus10 [Desulfurococcales archaeon]|nr:tRNA pseudouridine(54/55) synthase Pus10 [Desulfurococcales archaeon]